MLLIICKVKNFMIYKRKLPIKKMFKILLKNTII